MTTAKSRPKRQTGKTQPAQATPLLEWIAAAVGGVLILAVIGILVWQAVAGQDRPPAFAVRSLGASPTADGFILEIRVDNLGDRPAAQVEVEGELSAAQGQETASVTFDYVPAGSSRTGGLIFKSDPRLGQVELGAKGYSDP